MRRFELIAPCHFGMESVLKREITDLGYDITEVADGSQFHIGYNYRSQKACHRTHRQYAKHFCLQCFLLFFPSYPHIVDCIMIAIIT